MGAALDRNQSADEKPNEAALARARDGSVRLDGNAPLPSQEPPPAYEITYRLEDTTTEVGQVTTARIRVRRPFESHVLLLAGAPPGGRVNVERKSRFGELGLIGNRGRERQVLHIPPAVAGSDLRPDIALKDAETDRLIERREQRRVLGRRCQVWRMGSSIAAGELVAIGSRPGEYADACIDGRGFVLEEVWILDDRRVRRRLVTKLDTSPEFIAGEFELQGA